MVCQSRARIGIKECVETRIQGTTGSDVGKSLPPGHALSQRRATLGCMPHNNPEVDQVSDHMDKQAARVLVHNDKVMLLKVHRSIRSLRIRLFHVDPQFNAMTSQVGSTGKTQNLLCAGAEFWCASFLQTDKVEVQHFDLGA